MSVNHVFPGSIENILYYLEPQIELEDPLFRYATFRSHIIPEIKCLKSFKPSLEIKVILSENIYTKAISEGLEISGCECIIINGKDIDSISGDNYEASMRWAEGDISASEIKEIPSLIASKLEGFYPDVTITYESPSPFMKLAFPDSVHLNSMFGAFSRAPFPAFGILDPCGLYKNSYQSIYRGKLKEGSLDSNKSDLLRLIRRDAAKSLAKNLPYKRFVSEIYEEFDSAYIVACQIDKYFAFNSCSDFSSQYEVVEFALSNTPKNIAVIVTEHGYRRQISNEQVDKLKEKYCNFIYLENIENVPGPSQFLVPYIDGVLTVSSSIAYQCALWRKPLFTVGRSHVDIMSTSIDISEFIEQVTDQKSINNDILLYNLLAKVHLSHKFDIFNGENYFNRMNNIYQTIKFGSLDDLFSDEMSVPELRKRLWEGRKGWLLDKEIAMRKIDVQADHLRVAMAEAKAISFDLFDTLVERDFIEPHELFLFIEPKVQEIIGNRNFKFHDIRRRAEADVRRPTQGHFEITIDQIYEKIGELTGLDDRTLALIMKTEMEAELCLVHPKKKMIKEFKFAELTCTIRTIITDIYFEKEFIDKVVHKIGLDRHVDILMSSATNKTRKHNGTIYPEYLQLIKEFNIEARQALHVGDNKTADGDMAKKNGLRSYVFPKAMDNYRRSKAAMVLEKTFSTKHSSTSILNGVFANRFNSDHWNKFDPTDTFSGSPYKYGYMAIGPMVLGFTQWLYRRAKQTGTKHLYFLARDGWILKHAFDTLYKNHEDAPETHYLYASRRAVTLPSISNVDDVIELASQNFNPRSLSSLLKSRFDIEWGEIDKKLSKKYKYRADSIVTPSFETKKLHDFLKEISSLILDKANKERSTLLEYLEGEDFIENVGQGHTAVVDIGYSGSMQFYLGKILSTDKIGGFYFLTHNHSRNYFGNAIFDGYLQGLDDHRIAYRHQLNDHVFVFEAALSSLEGSLINFTRENGKLKINLLDAEEERTRKPILEKIHRGSNDFVRDISLRFDKYKDMFEISPLLSTRIILDYANHPSPKDASIFDNFEVENLFGGGSVWLIAKPNQNHMDINGFIKPDVTQFLIEQSKWKNGARQRYKLLSPSSAVNNKSLKSNSIGKEKTIIVDLMNKKRAKLKNTPYRFFNDAKNPIIRNLKWFFEPQTSRSQVLGLVLRKTIN
ncbi:hypothetical protein ACK39D_01375 [Aeromonas veronii]